MEQAKMAAAEDKVRTENDAYRAARANVDAALAILDKAPDVAPDPGEEIREVSSSRRSKR